MPAFIVSRVLYNPSWEDNMREGFEVFAVHMSRAMIALAVLALMLLFTGAAFGIDLARAYPTVFLRSALAVTAFMVVMASMGGLLHHIFRQRAKEMWKEHLRTSPWCK